MTLALEGTPVHKNITSGISTTIGPFSTAKTAQVFIAVLSNPSSVYTPTSVSSITGGGLTFSSRVVAYEAMFNQPIALWTAKAASSLTSVTFTINYTVSLAYSTIDVFAFSGQDTTTIFDTNAAVPAAKNASDPISISTSNMQDVIIAAFRMASTVSPTQGIGFTEISGAHYQCVEYKIVSSVQTGLSCTLGAGSGNANACVADALMQASAGGGGGPMMRRRRESQMMQYHEENWENKSGLWQMNKRLAA
jgi:hypothetical protein